MFSILRLPILRLARVLSRQKIALPPVWPMFAPLVETDFENTPGETPHFASATGRQTNVRLRQSQYRDRGASISDYAGTPTQDGRSWRFRNDECRGSPERTRPARTSPRSVRPKVHYGRRNAGRLAGLRYPGGCPGPPPTCTPKRGVASDAQSSGAIPTSFPPFAPAGRR